MWQQVIFLNALAIGFEMEFSGDTGPTLLFLQILGQVAYVANDQDIRISVKLIQY